MLIPDPEAALPQAIRDELKQIEELMGVEPLLKLLTAMRQDLAEKPLASRFSTTKPANHNMSSKMLSAGLRLSLTAEGDTESAYKKGELDIKLVGIIGMLVNVLHMTKAVVTEVRVSQTEFTE